MGICLAGSSSMFQTPLELPSWNLGMQRFLTRILKSCLSFVPPRRRSLRLRSCRVSRPRYIVSVHDWSRPSFPRLPSPAWLAAGVLQWKSALARERYRDRSSAFPEVSFLSCGYGILNSYLRDCGEGTGPWVRSHSSKCQLWG